MKLIPVEYRDQGITEAAGKAALINAPPSSDVVQEGGPAAGASQG